MIDVTLLIRAFRGNAIVALMTIGLIGFGAILLHLFADGPAYLSQAQLSQAQLSPAQLTQTQQSQPQLSQMPWVPHMPWLDSLAPEFWRGAGIFFTVASLLALVLCLFCVGQRYRHYLVEHHGVIHNAVVRATELKEISIDAGGEGPRQVQIGHLRYSYELGGRRFHGTCVLGEADIELYRKLRVGAHIPILVLPHKPRYSLLHHGRLNQQYRWSEPPHAAPARSALA